MAQQSWNNIWKDLPVKGIVYENLYPGLLRHNNPVDATNGEGGGHHGPFATMTWIVPILITPRVKCTSLLSVYGPHNGFWANYMHSAL